MIKFCSWMKYDILISSGDYVYKCKTCGYKLRVKSFELPPTISIENRCYKDE